MNLFEAGLRVIRSNLAGASIAATRMDGMTIDGILVTDLLDFWRAGHEEKKS